MKRPSYSTQKVRREKTRNINVKLAGETVRENRLREDAARRKKLAWIDEVVVEFHQERKSAQREGNPN